MKLNRRKILFGVGMVAAGIGTAFGTGSFVQKQVTRDVTVSITSDDSEEVQLPIKPTENLETNGRVNVVDDGGPNILRVDAESLPQDSTVTFGEFDDDETIQTEAITVENQNAFESAIDLDVSLGTSDNLEIELLVRDQCLQSTTVNEGGSTTISTISHTDSIGLGIRIVTSNSTVGQTVPITLSATTVDETEQSCTDYVGYSTQTLDLNGVTVRNSHTY